MWLHRVDVARATGRPVDLDGDSDRRVVEDVVAEWAGRHGQPFHHSLHGPAGGEFHQGEGGPHLEFDPVEFCRIAVALVLFVPNGTLAMSACRPHIKTLLAAADEATDGPLERELTDLVHDARVVGALRMVVGIGLATIFLIVNKPGWAGSVAVAGTGLVLGASPATLASRRSRQPLRSHAEAE